MPRNKYTESLLRSLGEGSSREDLLGPLLFPGLSIDNVGSMALGGMPGSFPNAGSDAVTGVGSQIAQISQQLNNIQNGRLAQIDSLTSQDIASSGGTSSAQGSGTGILSSLGNVAGGLLGGSFGLSPIVSGIMDLFGGGGQQIQALVPYTLPPSIQYEGGAGTSTGGATLPVDYGENGTIRTLGASSTSNQAGPAQSNIQITVNAMDSQSFLDNSTQIARAVREALLNSNSLGSVIADL
jgi:hypothetical protein